MKNHLRTNHNGGTVPVHANPGYNRSDVQVKGVISDISKMFNIFFVCNKCIICQDGFRKSMLCQSPVKSQSVATIVGITHVANSSNEIMKIVTSFVNLQKT